jgi:hypothetical protein
MTKHKPIESVFIWETLKDLYVPDVSEDQAYVLWISLVDPLLSQQWYQIEIHVRDQLSVDGLDNRLKP